MSSDTWRVVDSKGETHEAPTPQKGPAWPGAHAWRCGSWGGGSPRGAVTSWAWGTELDWREILEPNQPTRAEAIAAAVTHAAEAARLLERERCAWHARAVRVEFEDDSKRPAHETRSYGNGGYAACFELESRIESGEPVPS